MADPAPNTNQIGELSVGVSANVEPLQAGLQQAEAAVAESAETILQKQKEVEAAAAEAAKITAAKREQIAQAQEAIHARQMDDLAELAAAEAAATGVLQQKAAASSGGLGERFENATKPISKVTAMLGRLTFVIGGVTTAVGLLTAAYDFLVNRDKRVSEQIKERQKEYEKMNALALSIRESIESESLSDTERQIKALEEEMSAKSGKRGYDRQQAEYALSLLQDKLRKERSAKDETARRSEQQDYERIINETRMAEARASGEENELEVRQAIEREEIEREIARETNVTRQQLLKERLSAVLRAQQVEFDEYVKNGTAANTEVSADAKKKADDAAKAMAESYFKAAEQIAAALTNSFNQSAQASRQFSSQFSADISRIEALITQLIRTQRR